MIPHDYELGVEENEMGKIMERVKFWKAIQFVRCTRADLHPNILTKTANNEKVSQVLLGFSSVNYNFPVIDYLVRQEEIPNFFDMNPNRFGEFPQYFLKHFGFRNFCPLQ